LEGRPFTTKETEDPEGSEALTVMGKDKGPCASGLKYQTSVHSFFIDLKVPKFPLSLSSTLVISSARLPANVRENHHTPAPGSTESFTELETGLVVGWAAGASVGFFVGALVGAVVGALVGAVVGAFVAGADVGAGRWVGAAVAGGLVGLAVGALVAAWVGAAVGAFVGFVGAGCPLSVARAGPVKIMGWSSQGHQ
jgi:hypothetical protein